MKTVVLFHRLELTDLFAAIGRMLEGELRIVHLAYSKSEADRLRQLGVTESIPIFLDEVERLYPSTIVNETSLQELDAFFIRNSGGVFNLNGAIQSDRGFTLLSLDETERLTLTYHRFWRNFLEKHNANIVLHELCSLMFNFIAALHCTARGGDYYYQVMAQGPGAGFYHLLMTGFEFTCPDLDRASDAIRAGSLPVDSERCAAFLADFHKSFSVFLGGAFPRRSLVQLAIVAGFKWATRKLRSNPYDRILANIDHWQHEQNTSAEKFRNLRRYRSEVRFDEFDRLARYFFYPIHLEPEAVVLYNAHGIYTNQVKLIQNIAAQLPPGVLLYVKDHPHDHGYRSADDYLTLKAIPNIRLLDSRVSGKEVTASSLGVITITGTAGFEAALFGKKVFTFGKTFYSSCAGVTYVHNIRDLRRALYDSQTLPSGTQRDIHSFLSAYFAALRPGFTDYFAGRAQRSGIDLDMNAGVVSRALLTTLRAAK